MTSERMAGVGFLILVSMFISYQAQETVDTGPKLKGIEHRVSIDGNESTVYAYLGIPYAKPPLGELRFARPVKNTDWDGDATKEPNSCIQPRSTEFEKINAIAKSFVNSAEMSEDCLYLNVWQPKTEKKDLPIMIWIHGGGFMHGSASLDAYNGTMLAAKEEVVIVAVQYRLGAFGFLKLSDGQNGEIASGNQGLFDILMAIEWVREHAKDFDADAEKITLFGESAGAIAASIFWLSPKSEHYFKRIILQSGSVFSKRALSDPTEAHERADSLSTLTDCKKDDRAATIACLQGKDPADILEGTKATLQSIAEKRCASLMESPLAKSPDYKLDDKAKSYCSLYYEIPFKPVIDGDLIPNNPEELVELAKKRATELIIGVNRNEAMAFLLTGMEDSLGVALHKDGGITVPEKLREKKIEEMLKFHMISVGKFLDPKLFRPDWAVIPAMLYGLNGESFSDNHYAHPSNIKYFGQTMFQKMEALVSDMDFICPTIDLVEKLSREKDTRVYLYLFDHQSSRSYLPKWTGVIRGAELEYIFARNYDTNKQQGYYQRSERNVTEDMSRRWANFAKTGEPNYGSGVRWLPYLPSNSFVNEDNQAYLRIGAVNKMERNLRRVPCLFWQHVEKITKSSD